MKIADSFGICKTNCHNGSYCYLERESLKLCLNNSCDFSNKGVPPISATPESFKIKQVPGAPIGGNAVFEIYIIIF